MIYTLMGLSNRIHVSLMDVSKVHILAKLESIGNVSIKDFPNQGAFATPK